MVQKRETKAINKLCVREILSLSFVCGAYFFDFCGRNLVCFVIAYNFNGEYAPEAGKTRMRTAFFMRVGDSRPDTRERWKSSLVLRLILPELMTGSKDLSKRPIYAVLNTHNLDMILQLKYMPIVMNPA